MLPVPVGGADVNVSVLPEMLYAVTGSCCTFSTKTSTSLVRVAIESVKATVELSPLKESFVGVDRKPVMGCLPAYAIS
jgi:hypothetical protein